MGTKSLKSGLGFTLLDGGMNTNDLPFNIKDNQAVLLDNLWYDNKVLSGRPGLIGQIENSYGSILDKSEYILLEQLMWMSQYKTHNIHIANYYSQLVVRAKHIQIYQE